MKLDKVLAIAIDGPVGVGKSTIAKLLARKLGIMYVDTGAMYRTVAYYCIQNNIDITSSAQVENCLDSINIQLTHKNSTQKIFLNGKDVTDAIRTQSIADTTSIIAANPAVRDKLVQLQRKIAEGTSIVMDGRDIGSQVLPGAQVKIYLDASPEVRARRRMLQLKSKGQPAHFPTILKETKMRDTRDTTRDISPLVKTPDAFYINSSNISQKEVVAMIMELVKE